MRKILIFLSMALIALSCNDFTTSPDTETETRMVSIYSRKTDTVLWSSTTENVIRYDLYIALYGLEHTEPIKFSLEQTNVRTEDIPEAVKLQIGEVDVTYYELPEVLEFPVGYNLLVLPIVLRRDENRLNHPDTQTANVLKNGWKTVLTMVPLSDNLRAVGGSFTLVEKKE